MSIGVCVTQETGYLSMKGKGDYSLSAGQTLADRVLAESLENNCKHIMLDVSEVIGDVTAMHRFFLGEYVSRCWKHTIRVAVVYRANDIDKLFENVAVNRGVQTIVVPDVQTALKWLIGHTPNKPEAWDGK